MNASIPFREADIPPYSQKKTVIRLFQNRQWYAGFVTHMTIVGTDLGIMIGPMVRFGHFEETPKTTSHAHGHLITEADRIIKGSREELAEQFVLPFPMKSNPSPHQVGVTHIESKNGTATISTRDKDVSSVHALFECEKLSSVDEED